MCVIIFIQSIQRINICDCPICNKYYRCRHTYVIYCNKRLSVSSAEFWMTQSVGIMIPLNKRWADFASATVFKLWRDQFRSSVLFPTNSPRQTNSFPSTCWTADNAARMGVKSLFLFICSHRQTQTSMPSFKSHNKALRLACLPSQDVPVLKLQTETMKTSQH